MVVFECMGIASEVSQPSLSALVAMAMAGIPISAEAMSAAFILECPKGEEKAKWGALAECEPDELDREWQRALGDYLVQVAPMGAENLVLFDPYWDML